MIFDIDDTLFDTTTLVNKARMNAVDAMVKSGLACESELVYNSLMKIVANYGANYDRHFDRLLDLLGHEHDPKIIAAGIVAYHDAELTYLKPDSDVLPTLIALKERGYRIGIVSNGRSVKQWEKMIRLGLHQIPDVVVISEEVGFEKPDARIFQVALNNLKLKPGEAAYVGDTIATDVLGANTAGLFSILLTKRGREERTVTKGEIPKATIERISELLSILQ